MPRKVREIKADLRRAGFIEQPGRGKGSHTYWQHPLLPAVRITVAGHDGNDAKRYNETDLREALILLAQQQKQG